jgi:PAS domain S-box-containing protein
MDAQSRKDIIWQYTVLALIISAVLALVGVVIGLAADQEATYTLKGVALLFNHAPVYWIIVLITLSIPVGVFRLVSRFTRKLVDLQQAYDYDQERLNQVSQYNLQLIRENYEADFPLAGEEDALGKSLLDLRNTLKSSKEHNLKLRQEEEQRSWIAESSAHFSEILRTYIHDLPQLSFTVIKDLTRYIQAIQGGFYLLDDTDPLNRVFNLTAFFAYDRRKFTDQQIKWGDGLIGTCALEQKIIHLKQIPDAYLTVTSGLGEANPNNLLIVPMQYENQIYGVLEFASFNAFEPNHLALVDKTAESVAATLSAIRTNLQTARLLEESKAQTQALTSHEEEMRQNMEELQATQEEATRQAQRFMVLEESINQHLIHAEFSTDGKLISANNLFHQKFEYNSDLALEGKPFNELIGEEDRERFREVWQKLVQLQEPFRGYIRHITRTEKDMWAIATLGAARKEDGSVERIMYLAIDTTAEKYASQKNNVVVDTLNTAALRLETDINGNIREASNPLAEVFQLSQKDIKSLAVFDLIHPMELDAFNKRWDAIIKGISLSGLLHCKTTGGKDIWLTGTFNAARNMAHEIDSIVFVGQDITREKQLESAVKEQQETLKKQERLLKDAEKELIAKLRETRTELLGQFKETERIKNVNEKTLEEMPDAIITTRHDNRIIFFNKAAEQLWKLERKDVLHQDISMLFPEHLTDQDELLGSFVRPGDHKITGQRRDSKVIDATGKETRVKIILTKARVDNENAYTAFIQFD